MENEIIVRSKMPGDDEAAANVALESFRDKYLVIGGDNETGAIALVQEEMKYRGKHENMFLAERNGKIAGIVEMLALDVPFISDSVLIELRLKHLGLAGGIRAVYLMSLMARNMDKNECCISQLGVLERERRHGIACSLIARAAQFTREHNKERLTLWVAEHNTPAVCLYEKEGFKPIDRLESKSCDRFFNTPVWLKMEMMNL